MQVPKAWRRSGERQHFAAKPPCEAAGGRFLAPGRLPATRISDKSLLHAMGEAGKRAVKRRESQLSFLIPRNGDF